MYLLAVGFDTCQFRASFSFVGQQVQFGELVTQCRDQTNLCVTQDQMACKQSFQKSKRGITSILVAAHNHLGVLGT